MVGTQNPRHGQREEEGRGEAGDPASGRGSGEVGLRGHAGAAPEAALEREADRLLLAAGAFRRSTGILSARRLRDFAEHEESIEEIAEAAALELGALDLWDEMDALAAWCGLTPTQKAALAMWRLAEYSPEEIARELGCTRRNVQRLLGRAMRRVRRGAPEFPGSARALFWEEVRRKSRMIYRKPSHGWHSGAGGKEEGD